MKERRYTFNFKGGSITVWAMGKEEAEILAKAEAIRRGWSYEIVKPNIEHLNMDIDWNALTEDEQEMLHKLLTKAHSAVKEEQ
jgi:DNA-binding protein YbaB